MLRNFQDPEYKKWRSSVYKRDQYKCQWPNCNSKKKLNAHHIKTWSSFPGLRFCVDNGITLCYLHHKMIKNLEHIYEAVFLKIVQAKQKDQ
jgi:predicted restriction endonuclease